MGEPLCNPSCVDKRLADDFLVLVAASKEADNSWQWQDVPADQCRLIVSIHNWTQQVLLAKTTMSEDVRLFTDNNGYFISESSAVISFTKRFLARYSDAIGVKCP